MKAIILAAGRGSRMGEKTKNLPKCLTTLKGKTLLERQLDALTTAGIEEIAVITGYKSEEITKRFGDLKYFHNENWENTNMVATLLKADEWLKSDACIISYSDIVYTKKAVELLKNSAEDIAITYYTEFLKLWQRRFKNPLEDLETFKIDENSYLTEIGARAKSLDEIEGQYMGLLKFSPNGYEKIRSSMGEDMPKPVERIDMTGLLSYLLAKNIKIKAVSYNELWLEADNERDLEIYESDGEIVKELL